MKVNFLLIAATTGWALACQPTGNSSVDRTKVSTSQERKEDRNKRIVLATLHGFERGSVDSVIRVENTIADFVDRREGSPPQKGIASAPAGLRQFMNAFPDYRGYNFRVIAGVDDVMVYGEWSGTWKRDFLGMKVTGKSFNVADVAIFRIDQEGKVVEHHAT